MTASRPGRPSGGAVLAMTVAVQTIVMLALMVPVSVAPEIADRLAVPPWYVGYHISVGYAVATVFSLVSGTAVRRFGACRMSQACLFFTAVGSLLFLAPSAAIFACGSAAIGTALGFTNPTASHLLARFTDSRRRNLIFSVNKTGVPLGGVLAGLLGPGLATAWDWRLAPIAAAALAVLLAIAVQPLRAVLDDDRDPLLRLRRSGADGLAVVFRTRQRKWLTIGGLGLEIAQLSLVAYLVTTLVEELDFGLLAAGYVLSVSQLAGVGGRVMWGWFADRLGDGLLLLAGLALWAMLALAAVAASPAWPPLGIAATFVLLALAVMGWYGVHLAEVARLSPSESVATATGGNVAIIGVAAFTGPSLFAGLYVLTGSYTDSFGLLALPCAFSAWATLRARRIASAIAG